MFGLQLPLNGPRHVYTVFHAAPLLKLNLELQSRNLDSFGDSIMGMQLVLKPAETRKSKQLIVQSKEHQLKNRTSIEGRCQGRESKIGIIKLGVFCRVEMI